MWFSGNGSVTTGLGQANVSQARVSLQRLKEQNWWSWYYSHLINKENCRIEEEKKGKEADEQNGTDINHISPMTLLCKGGGGRCESSFQTNFKYNVWSQK